MSLVVPAVVIALAGVFAPYVLPRWVINGFGWAWRILIAMSVVSYLLGAVRAAWETWRERFKR